MVRMIEGCLYSRKAFVKEVERLGKAEQHHGVDDAESQHIAGYHAIHHRDEWSRQSDGPVIVSLFLFSFCSLIKLSWKSIL